MNCQYCNNPVPANATTCPGCGAQVAQQPQQQAQPQQTPNDYRSTLPIKSKVVAALLAILLGGLGIHKFYLGQTGAGIFYLLFCWTYVPGILALIEGIMILCSSDEAFQEKYKCRIG